MEFVKIEDLIGYQIKGLWGEEFDGSFHCTPVIKTNNMNYDGTIDLDNLTYRYIKHDSILENYLQKGDLLIEKSGGTKTHSVGYVTYFDGEEKKYVCNNFILGLRPDTTKINSKYLFYNLRFMYENGNFSDCYNKTTGIQNLKIKLYLAKKIKLIELSKQSEVIEVLDSITKQISSLKSLLENLDKIVKSQFIEMFENEEYEKVTVSSVINTGFWLMPATPEFTVDGEVPFITSKNIKNRTIDFDNVKYISKEAYKSISANRPTQKGDILVSMIGTLGQTAVIQDDREFYGQNLYLLRLNNSIVDTTYFCEFFNSDMVQHELHGKRNQSTQAYLKANHVEDLVLPLAPLEIQKQFTAFVEQTDKSKYFGGVNYAIC